MDSPIRAGVGKMQLSSKEKKKLPPTSARPLKDLSGKTWENSKEEVISINANHYAVSVVFVFF